MSRATHLLVLSFLTLLAFGGPQPLKADAACEQECNLSHQQCVDACGTDGWCWDSCDQQRDQCWNACQNCPSTRDYSTRTILSRQYTNRNGCFQDHLFLSGGKRYYEYYTKERRDNYRETTQCSGAKSTQLLSSVNFNYYCWVRGNLGSDSCGSPAPNYLPICH